jgi:glycine/D-amino acid oxidase-like deaminating enzyme
MVTKRRDLRGGTSLWSAIDISIPHRRSPPRRYWDAIIVGAGISGALIAHRLARRGRDVLVVDRREPMSGSTRATTAMIEWELDVPLRKLSDAIGARRAGAVYRACFEAVGQLEYTIRSAGIRCGWRKRDAIYLAGDAYGWRALREEARLREGTGLPTRFLNAAALRSEYSLERSGALVSAGAGELDPVRLTAGLLQRARQQGCIIAAPIDIVAIDTARNRVCLQDGSGNAYEARQAIFASGYETLKQIPAKAYKTRSTWAIATAPARIGSLPLATSIIWEASDPYIYVRSTADGRVIAGGEDEDFVSATKRDRMIGRKAAMIVEKLGRLLPSHEFEVEYAWAGCFAESPVGLPYIAEPAGLPNCLAVLGSGGNGITFAVLAAAIAADWVTGHRHPSARLFEHVEGKSK